MSNFAKRWKTTWKHIRMEDIYLLFTNKCRSLLFKLSISLIVEGAIAHWFSTIPALLHPSAAHTYTTSQERYIAEILHLINIIKSFSLILTAMCDVSNHKDSIWPSKTIQYFQIANKIRKTNNFSKVLISLRNRSFCLTKYFSIYRPAPLRC